MNRQFSINLAANVANFAFTLLVGLWLTPYLVRHLGVGGYGLVPLATTATAYLALFTVALTSVSGRFLTIALERGDHAGANRVFNTAFWGSAAVLLLLLPPCVWLALHADRFFDVPPGFERDFVGLSLAALGVFYLATLGSGFGVSSFCRNRFDLSNAVNLVGTVARVAAIVALFNLTAPRAWHVGAGLLLAAAVGFVGSWAVWRRLTPMLSLRRSAFDFSTLRDLARMGGWIVVNSIGSLLFLSIDLLVVNRWLGPDATGQYGAVLTWSGLLRSFAGVVAGVFAPTVLMLYSRGDREGLVRYARRSVKFVGLAVAIPVALLCGLSRPLLELWLGPSFAGLAPLLCLLTLHLCVNLAVLPLFNIQVATARVRLPGIVTCVMGAANLALAIALCGPAQWGMYGVVAAGAIMLSAKNVLFTPLYAARVLGLPAWTFCREIVPIVAVTCLLAAATWVTVGTLHVASWPALLAAGAFWGAIGLASLYVLLLDEAERAQALRMLRPWRQAAAQ